jgi:hypothetical protein
MYNSINAKSKVTKIVLLLQKNEVQTKRKKELKPGAEALSSVLR